MSDATDRDTIDWDAFWREASESARDTARPGRFDKPDQFRRFFDSRGVPATFGSVGCGPADAEFELARRYPGVEFCCYDAATSVVAENRERAGDTGSLRPRRARRPPRLRLPQPAHVSDLP